MADSYSRRDLFTMFRRSLRTPDKDEKKAPPRPSGPRIRMRPPGAIGEDRFGDTCLRCTACMTVCPREAIKPLGAEHGPLAGTPHIVARDAPCVVCDGLLCTHMCPSGALQPLVDGAPARLGQVERRRRQCQHRRREHQEADDADRVMDRRCQTGERSLGPHHRHHRGLRLS